MSILGPLASARYGVIPFEVPRGLDRSLILHVASGQWIRDAQTVLISGATGSGNLHGLAAKSGRG